MELKKVIDNPALLPKPASLTYAKPALASNTVRTPTQRPNSAVDDDLTTYWAVEETVRQGWLEIDLEKEVTFTKAMFSEQGNNINKFELQYRTGREWRSFTAGTTIGKKLEKTFKPIEAQHVRLNILDSKAAFKINEFQLYE